MGFLLRRGIDRYNGRVTAEPFVQESRDPEPPLRARRRRLHGARRPGGDRGVPPRPWRTPHAGRTRGEGLRHPDVRLAVGAVPDRPGRLDSRRRLPLQRHGRCRSSRTRAVRSRWRGSSCPGEFYDGDRTSGNVTLRIRPNRFLRSETTTEINDVKLLGRHLRVEGLPAAPGDGGDAAGAGERVRPVQRPVAGGLGQRAVQLALSARVPTSSWSTTRRGTART